MDRSLVGGRPLFLCHHPIRVSYDMRTQQAPEYDATRHTTHSGGAFKDENLAAKVQQQDTKCVAT